MDLTYLKEEGYNLTLLGIFLHMKLCYEVGDFGTNSAFVDYISLTCLIDLSL